MRELAVHFNRPYVKSARIVGDVIGKYHPHGDTAAYDTIVRMAQDFSMRYPLVDGQGNFGSMDGDSPAAMRYTEARMTKIDREIIADLEKDTVDFIPTYDNSMTEPTVMPSKTPNLLINGSSGLLLVWQPIFLLITLLRLWMGLLPWWIMIILPFLNLLPL